MYLVESEQFKMKSRQNFCAKANILQPMVRENLELVQEIYTEIPNLLAHTNSLGNVG